MATALALVRAHWRVLVALALGVAIGWWLHRPAACPPSPAVHLAEDDHKAVAKASERDTETVTGPGSKMVLDFDPNCPPTPAQVATALAKRPARATARAPGDDFQAQVPTLLPGLRRATIIDTGPRETVSHAEAASHAVEDKHLELQLTPPPAAAAPGWELQLGVEDALGARTVRLAARRHLFGPFWVEISAVPARLELGAAAAVAF